MLIIENFNEYDLQKIKSIPKSFRAIGLFYIILLVPASFLFGLLGLTKKGNGYFPTTISLLIMFSVITALYLLKEFTLYYKDKSKQKKYKGTITVTYKSDKKNDNKIHTDAPELKKTILA